MATTTYEPIQSQTLGSTQATVTFSDILQNYTDLVLVISNLTANVDNVYLTFNGDTNSVYSRTYMFGNGTSTGASRQSNQNGGYIIYKDAGTDPIMSITNIQNYSSSNVNKTFLTRTITNSSGTKATMVLVGLWRNTAAITSIALTTGNVNFNAGSIFTLYGIANADVATGVKATGGIITYDDTYYYHTFGASSTFTPKQSLTVDYLVVAGGGGGGNASSDRAGGGGGAGGMKTGESQSLTSSTTYTITVGSGGAISTNGTSSSIAGTGLTTISTTGGGAGANGATNAGAGSAGGSGGGGTPQGGAGGAGVSGEGNAGGQGRTNASNGAAGGGGGKGAVGDAANNNDGGNGGNGGASSISGSSVTYAGGGGGGAGLSASDPAGIGGAGGGGKGGGSNSGSVAGTVNLGGGGGGGRAQSNSGSSGGSGIVIIRYTKA